jgi:hypothetical protein
MKSLSTHLIVDVKAALFCAKISFICLLHLTTGITQILHQCDLPSKNNVFLNQTNTVVKES